VRFAGRQRRAGNKKSDAPGWVHPERRLDVALRRTGQARRGAMLSLSDYTSRPSDVNKKFVTSIQAFNR